MIYLHMVVNWEFDFNSLFLMLLEAEVDFAC